MTWQSLIGTLARPFLRSYLDTSVFLPQKSKLTDPLDHFLERFVSVRTSGFDARPRKSRASGSYIAQNIDLDIRQINIGDEVSRPAPRFAKLRRVFEKDQNGELVVPKSLEKWYAEAPLYSQLTNSDVRKAQLELLCWEVFDLQMRE